jgi:hypothetical protein
VVTTQLVASDPISSESEILAQVGALSRVGRIADRVVIDILRARHNEMNISDSTALRSAVRMLDGMVHDLEDGPAWAAGGSQHLVRYLAESSAAISEKSPTRSAGGDGVTVFLRKLIDLVGEILSGSSEEATEAYIMAVFDDLSGVTLSVTHDTMIPRESKWLAQ